MDQRLKWVLPFAAIGVGVAGAVLLFATAPKIEEQPPPVVLPLVTVIGVEPVRHQLHVRTHGTVSARTESDLVPQVAGLVVYRSPQLVSGGYFAAADVLLEIERVDYEVALERARALLSRALSDQVRSGKELTRVQGLKRQGVASDAQLDDAERAANVAAAGVREAQAAVAQAERDLTRTSLRAPFEGRVRRTNVDVGQFVNRGVPIATLYATDRAEVRLPVADAELAFLDLPRRPDPTIDAKGPSVTLRATFAGVGHEWEARVVRTEGEIDPRSRMVHVVAEVKDPYGEHDGRPPLAVGLFVEAEMEGRVLDDVVVVPRSAMRDTENAVVADAEDRLQLRRGTILRRERHQVVMRADSFQTGDRIVITGLESAVPGTKVRTTGGGSVTVGREAPEARP